jgi:exopolysaccharide biosynthesis predicted pyruvyltransferase EpsI
MELDLRKYLARYKGAKVDFFRFPGNYGDSLIWHGTKALLSSLNIVEQYVDAASKRYNSVLFIDGGGNLVDYYSDVRDFLVKKPGVYDEVVILPHTIFGERQVEALNSVTSELTIFCRERVSANFLEEMLTRSKVYLWHDCAFYNKFPQTSTGEGILNAFRVDKESVLRALPESNIDVSRDGYATKPLGEFIDTLQKYEQVNTDRLHIAIGAALLGKCVVLYSNSYYKNKAVYDYSLRKFPNMSFVENFQ